MSMQLALSLTDIPWLRRAALATGAVEMPPAIASKLLSGGFVERDVKRGSLTITARGKLALDRLT
jgi:hypothetical protein